MKPARAILIASMLGVAVVWLLALASPAGAATVSLAPSIGSTATASDPAPNWEDPKTYADLAGALGLTVAGGSLFVGWKNRKDDLQLKGHVELQEWAITAIDLSNAVRSELDAPTDLHVRPATLALHRRDRLKVLVEQVQEAQSAFVHLSKSGEPKSRTPVLLELGHLAQQGRGMQEQYHWLHSQQERLEKVPGDVALSDQILKSIQDIDERADVLREHIRAFRGSVGKWLETSGAVPADVLEWLRTFGADPPAPDNPPSAD